MDFSTKSLFELEIIITDWGFPKYRAKQVYDWVHGKLVTNPRQMLNLPRALKLKLENCFHEVSVAQADKLISSDKKSIKYLFRLYDGECVEAVLMNHEYGNSVCVSSQAGCRMGCQFCASAVNGFKRNLTGAEMLGQVYEIKRQLTEIGMGRIDNIVIMGIGEPLDNYENIISFIKQVTNPDGFHLSQRAVTISTCGISEKIIQLANEGFAITLALSLHSANPKVRCQLMPIAKSEDFARLLPAIEHYFITTGRRITLEYALIDGINDSAKDALALCALCEKYLKNVKLHVNLIFLNRVEGKPFKPSGAKAAKEFENCLKSKHFNVTVRKSLGADIDGACGQLRATN